MHTDAHLCEFAQRQARNAKHYVHRLILGAETTNNTNERTVGLVAFERIARRVQHVLARIACIIRLATVHSFVQRFVSQQHNSASYSNVPASPYSTHDTLASVPADTSNNQRNDIMRAFTGAPTIAGDDSDLVRRLDQRRRTLRQNTTLLDLTTIDSTQHTYPPDVSDAGISRSISLSPSS
jgi:hypothetical protein